MKIAMVAEHASPLTEPGAVDAAYRTSTSPGCPRRMPPGFVRLAPMRLSSWCLHRGSGSRASFRAPHRRCRKDVAPQGIQHHDRGPTGDRRCRMRDRGRTGSRPADVEPGSAPVTWTGRSPRGCRQSQVRRCAAAARYACDAAFGRRGDLHPVVRIVRDRAARSNGMRCTGGGVGNRRHARHNRGRCHRAAGHSRKSPRRSLGLAGRDRACARYSWDRVAADTARIYDRLVSDHVLHAPLSAGY